MWQYMFKIRKTTSKHHSKAAVHSVFSRYTTMYYVCSENSWKHFNHVCDPEQLVRKPKRSHEVSELLFYTRMLKCPKTAKISTINLNVFKEAANKNN